ncbi:MAG: hypothetical protein ABIV11_02760 [Gemmatimonadaceae bacterium]
MPGSGRIDRFRLFLFASALCALAACGDEIAGPVQLEPGGAPLFAGEMQEHGNGWFYRGDSARITITAVAPSCDSPSHLIGYLWPDQYSLTYNACGELGRTWMKYPRISSDSSPLFFTTEYVIEGYGTSNRMTGVYPRYVFYLKDDWKGNFGDLEVTVELFPCNATGDPILDAPEVRDSLKAAMVRSNLDSTPESLQRREVGGLIFRHVDSVGVTSFYFKEAPSYNRQTACMNEWGPFNGNASGDMPVASFHTHPNASRDKVYGCRGPGAQQFPGGPGRAKIAGDARKTGGGSDPDWEMTDNQSWNIPVYVMTKTGLMSRLDPGTDPSLRRRNKNMWYWKNNPTGCRGW